MPSLHGQICTLPSRILLATDLTDLKNLLPVAIEYALKCKAALKLVHVIPDVSTPGSELDRPVLAEGETTKQHAEKILAEATNEAKEAGVKCSSFVACGQVSRAIVRIVERWKADRVIVGSHGPRKLEQEVLGSIAESIFREVEIPVLAIGPYVQGLHSHASQANRILLATALDRDSVSVTTSVVRFAKIHQAELTMLHVIPEIAKAHPSALRISAYAERKFQEILSDISKELRPVSCMVESGPIVGTILRVAQQGDFDLIVLSGVSASSFRADIMPGTAYGVVCGAPCPVLILKNSAALSSSSLPAA